MRTQHWNNVHPVVLVAGRLQRLALCLRRRKASAALRVMLLVITACPAIAANLPVFRHALERWPVSDYELVVFHRGELGPAEQSLVDQLRIAPGQLFANVQTKTVNVTEPMGGGMEELWTCQTNPLPPWAVVRAPDSSADASAVWAGHLTASAVTALIDSPARRKIAQELLRGATAVWVLLECGEPMRDEAAVDTLSAELKRLERKLALPKRAATDAKLRSALPLAVQFALVRVTRSDPAEEFLVTLLQHGQPLFAARPAAFPVYGRGRVLGSLTGREIETAAIEEACVTLTAACAHEAKDQNPGRDLLLAANWNSIFDPAKPKQNSAAAARSPGVANAEPSRTAEPDARSGSRWSLLVSIAVGLFALAALVTARVVRKPR